MRPELLQSQQMTGSEGRQSEAMGQKSHAFIFIAIVAVLGILAYCAQWSTLQFHWTSQWPLAEDTRLKDCNSCRINSHLPTRMESEENSLRMSVDPTQQILKGIHGKMPMKRFELYTPPPEPCLDIEHPRQFLETKADVLSHGPFISESINPCWWNGMSRSATSQLHCLPYFFLAGVSKCGSTDIFSRLSGHPQVIPPSHKEPRWFDWKRFASEEYTFAQYVSNFTQAAWQISRDIGHYGTSNKVVGDGSPTYFWRNFHWAQYAGNEGCTEPRFLIPDTIHQLLPQAKIIVSFRNPVNSIYSKYLSWPKKRVHCSPEHFHKVVEEEIHRYMRCFARWSVRSCAYNITLSDLAQVRLEKGLYVVYLSDWLRVFPRKQLHIIRFEDYIKDIAGHLQKIFYFLDLDAMPDNDIRRLAALPAFNQGRHYSVGEMLPATQRLLQQFYAPFNVQLAQLLNDTKYLWQPE